MAARRAATGADGLLGNTGYVIFCAFEVEVVCGLVVHRDIVGQHVDMLCRAGALREVGRAILYVETSGRRVSVDLHDIASGKADGDVGGNVARQQFDAVYVDGAPTA